MKEISKISLKIINFKNSAEYLIDLKNAKAKFESCSLERPKSIPLFDIKPEITDKLKNKFSTIHFENWESNYNLYSSFYATDMESWKLELTFFDNTKKRYKGYAAYPKEWTSFLAVIEIILPTHCKNDYKKIEIEYNFNQEINNTEDEKTIIKNSEKLVFDGEQEKIFITEKFSQNSYVNTEIFLDNNAVSNILCNYIGTVEKKPKKVDLQKFEQEKFRKTYTLKFYKYYEKKPLVYNGFYHNLDLPLNWCDIKNWLFRLIDGYHKLDIFNSDLDEPIDTKYKICTVFLESNFEKYLYKTSDESICVGDKVTVPFGESEIDGKVTKIDFLTINQMPIDFKIIKDIKHKK